MSKRIIVIGGGAAGMMAAGTAAARGLNVKLIEQNKLLGKKLMITGKGRCNVTNACDDVRDLINNVPTNGAFLYSAFYGFTNHQTMDFFENLGVPLKVERGERVFPVSDKSVDIVSALRRFLIENNVEIIRDRVDDILTADGMVNGVLTQKRGRIYSDSVILATGGMSYQSTGSTGDGYRFAKDCGLFVTDLKPGLCGINLQGTFYKDLQGLSLKNVSLTAKRENKILYQSFGDMLLTHFGISGPPVLSLSSVINRSGLKGVTLFLDLKPALDFDTLDRRLLRDFKKYKNKQLLNAMCELLPQKMIATVLSAAGISEKKNVNVLTKEERFRLLNALKEFPVKPVGLRGFEEAIITSGGVELSEINPKTMEAKKVSGLRFCGEVLDADAFTGGYNLQIAFSTGYAAGRSIR